VRGGIHKASADCVSYNAFVKQVLILTLLSLLPPIRPWGAERTQSTPPVTGFTDYGNVGYPLHGCVVYERTLEPVSGAALDVFTGGGARVVSTTTDANGNFSIPQLYYGTYSVEGTAAHINKIQGMFHVSRSAKSLLYIAASRK